MHIHRSGIRLAGMLAVAATAALLPAAPAPATLSPKWTAMAKVPNPAGAKGAELRDVAVVSATDVWTVGGWWSVTSHPLAAHWDGRGWTVATTPDATSPQEEYDLSAVGATAREDVWAVGSIRSTVPDASAVTTTLVLHFDGASWTVVPSPSPTSVGSASVLNDVDMRSATDGWAVGRTAVGGQPARALALRWQAGHWVNTGALPAPAELTSVDARSANDVWAVGSQQLTDGRTASLVVHWNGAKWEQLPVPAAAAATANDSLASVAALSATDVWAVGRTCQRVSGPAACKPLALRFVAGTWTVVPTSGGAAVLTEVIPFSATDVWATGYASLQPQHETDHAEHWDGQRFIPDTTLPPPPPPGGDTNKGEPASALDAAAGDPLTGELWVVGWAGDPTLGTTHALRRG